MVYSLIFCIIRVIPLKIYILQTVIQENVAIHNEKLRFFLTVITINVSIAPNAKDNGYYPFTSIVVFAQF